jgi:hypothetical protein
MYQNQFAVLGKPLIAGKTCLSVHDIPDPTPNSKVGAHAIVISDYCKSTGRITFKNSWGSTWGSGIQCCSREILINCPDGSFSVACLDVLITVAKPCQVHIADLGYEENIPEPFLSAIGKFDLSHFTDLVEVGEVDDSCISIEEGILGETAKSVVYRGMLEISVADSILPVAVKVLRVRVGSHFVNFLLLIASRDPNLAPRKFASDLFIPILLMFGLLANAHRLTIPALIGYRSQCP